MYVSISLSFIANIREKKPKSFIFINSKEKGNKSKSSVYTKMIDRKKQK